MTGWDSKFDLQLPSVWQHVQLSRSIPEKHWHVACMLTNQPTIRTLEPLSNVREMIRSAVHLWCCVCRISSIEWCWCGWFSIFVSMDTGDTAHPGLRFLQSVGELYSSRTQITRGCDQGDCICWSCAELLSLTLARSVKFACLFFFLCSLSVSLSLSLSLCLSAGWLGVKQW